MKRKKIKIDVVNTYKMQPHKCYNVVPGQIATVDYSNGHTCDVIAVEDCGHFHCNGPAVDCVFRNQDDGAGGFVGGNGVCKLTSMFCLSRRPYVWFKKISDTMEEL